MEEASGALRGRTQVLLVALAPLVRPQRGNLPILISSFAPFYAKEPAQHACQKPLRFCRPYTISDKLFHQKGHRVRRYLIIKRRRNSRSQCFLHLHIRRSIPVRQA
ncbi:hypothetical protein HYQ46_010171 [Verticillium longisporum]|nr:hypothetical protein HYQ46_010171 [Verticillium longisporum]